MGLSMNNLLSEYKMFRNVENIYISIIKYVILILSLFLCALHDFI